jgi:hypothetical protein
MTTLDELLGRGGATSFFTNYEEARSFVQDSINNNQRFTPIERTRLLQLEQEAIDYVFTNTFYGTVCSKKEVTGPGQVDLTIQAGPGVRLCLMNYYYFLQDQFPLVTDDERFLAIFDAAAEGVKDVNTSDSDISDLFKWNKNTSIIAGSIVLLFLLMRD